MNLLKVFFILVAAYAYCNNPFGLFLSTNRVLSIIVGIIQVNSAKSMVRREAVEAKAAFAPSNNPIVKSCFFKTTSLTPSPLGINMARNPLTQDLANA